MNPFRSTAAVLAILSVLLLGVRAEALDTESLKPLIGEADALLLVNPQNEPVVSIHADRPLVPASVIKLLTVLAAFHALGPDYRFRTEWYLNPAGDVIVKGYGDPFLTSEAIREMAVEIARIRRHFRHLVVDGSFFADDIVIDGIEPNTEPYNAPVAALSVNFNTVAFQRTAKGAPVSQDPDLPLVPFALQKIRTCRISSGRITVAHDSREALQYAGEALRAVCRKAGIHFSGNILRAPVDRTRDKLLLSYRSRWTLEEMAARLLEFSSNFIANQIFLTMGAEAFGAPASLEKGRRVVEEYLRTTLPGAKIVVVEGSGISRSNRICATDMDAILVRFQPFRHLMRHREGEWFKTGTMNGIRNRTGFLEDADGGLWRFVVLLNTPGKSTESILKLIRPE
uniref:D-alanyl-D-alanine carboxypeptidase n=1 Tax=Desulfatirhabdium butyrativorans TaxID=340467 RepID=A0A7C4RTH8_9BACT